MDMGDRVKVNLCLNGIVIGRTFEEDPKVDLKTPWGMLNGIPMSVLSDGEIPESRPSNIRRMQPANQRGQLTGTDSRHVLPLRKEVAKKKPA